MHLFEALRCQISLLVYDRLQRSFQEACCDTAKKLILDNFINKKDNMFKNRKLKYK